MDYQQQLAQLPFVLDTFFLLISGALVMWMGSRLFNARSRPGKSEKHDRNTHQKHNLVCTSLP